MIIKKMTGVAIIIMSSAFITGCSLDLFNKADSIKHGSALSMKTETPKNVYFTNTYAHQKDNEIMVWGKVRLRINPTVTGGHVDIAAMDQDGTELYKSHEYTTPKVIHKDNKDGAFFKAQLPVVLPKGGYVFLTFHDQKYVEIKPAVH